MSEDGRMTEDDEIRYRIARLRAASFRAQAAREDLAAEAVKAGAAMRRLGELIQEGFDNEIYEHPDLMYLDVQLDGFYGGWR